MNDAYTTAPRTSSDDSRMIDAFDCSLPCAAARRSLRTMFSTSTMASSTMAPSAITKPASTIVLMVAPRA